MRQYLASKGRGSQGLFAKHTFAKHGLSFFTFLALAGLASLLYFHMLLDAYGFCVFLAKVFAGRLHIRSLLLVGLLFLF